jgi:puromycin-sensitive aminopeptidase
MEATSTIQLHALDLWLYKVDVDQGDDSLGVASVSTNFDEQTATIALKAPLQPSASAGGALATITIAFKGELNDKLAGFYRSYYTVDGERRVMATTQFEATDARRAFPCWDEPALKASFEVTLTTPVDRVAVSNMPVVETSIKDSTYGLPDKRTGKQAKVKVWRYAESPVMSTYLLAIIVGEFDSVSDYTREGVCTTVYTPVGKAEQGRFALKVACEALSFFQHFFGVEYPLRKSDLLAIPDFAAGAMENWGAVTYRETALLIDEQQSSASMKQRVAMVVCHELAHQWFGNLVTMEWWTHLWLNEGFATYCQYLAVDAIFPEWDVWTEFCTAVCGSAMKLDGMRSSHPIEVEVGHPDEVNEIFDHISYQKGACLIRMVSSYVGADKLSEGLQLYLKRHSFGNALTADLWAALAEVSGKPVPEIMEPWTSQMGYPVITVGEDGSLSQHRFLNDGGAADGADPAADASSAASLWEVPLDLVAVGGGTAASAAVRRAASPDGTVLSGRARAVSAAAGSGSALGFKLNRAQDGFYRVNYSIAQWDALRAALRAGDPALGARDRIGLVGDAFALAKAGLLPMATALGIAGECHAETEYAVWQEVSSNLSDLASLYAHEPFYPQFQAFVRALYGGVVGRLGWEAAAEGTSGGGGGDAHTATLFRSLVLNVLGSVGEDAAVVAEGARRFAKFIADPRAAPTTLPPDMRGLCFKLAVSQADGAAAEVAYGQLQSLYGGADTMAEEKNRCLLAMGRSPHLPLLSRHLQFALSADVRSQDKYLPFASASGNTTPGARELAWAFFTKHHAAVSEVSGLSLLGYIVSFVVKPFCTEGDARAVEAFFESHPMPQVRRKLDQSLEAVRANAARLGKERGSVAAFLADWEKQQQTQ